MKQNGLTFISIIDSDLLKSGEWNPYSYKYTQDNDFNYLSNFVQIEKVNGEKKDIKYFSFAPIEYKHIPKGDLINFVLEDKSDTIQGKFSFVLPNTLLFGTMRAYLGNICLTPLGEWINQHQDIEYAVNSEFAKIKPLDNCNFFWWAYLKSHCFLEKLPTGNGGTRPRISTELLGQIPVHIPNQDQRKEIDQKIRYLAQKSWSNYIENKLMLKKLSIEYGQ